MGILNFSQQVDQHYPLHLQIVFSIERVCESAQYPKATDKHQRHGRMAVSLDSHTREASTKEIDHHGFKRQHAQPA